MTEIFAEILQWDEGLEQSIHDDNDQASVGRKALYDSPKSRHLGNMMEITITLNHCP